MEHLHGARSGIPDGGFVFFPVLMALFGLGVAVIWRRASRGSSRSAMVYGMVAAALVSGYGTFNFTAPHLLSGAALAWSLPWAITRGRSARAGRTGRDATARREKVAFVMTDLNSGGAERAALDLAHAAQMYDCRIVAEWRRGDLLDDPLATGATFLSRRAHRISRVRRIVNLVRWLRMNRPVVVVSMLSPVVTTAASPDRGARCPVATGTGVANNRRRQVGTTWCRRARRASVGRPTLSGPPRRDPWRDGGVRESRDRPQASRRASQRPRTAADVGDRETCRQWATHRDSRPPGGAEATRSRATCACSATARESSTHGGRLRRR